MGFINELVKEFFDKLFPFPLNKEDVSAEYEDKNHDINVYGGQGITIYN